MSNTIKWSLVIAIAVGGLSVLWSNGVFGEPLSQSAAVINTTGNNQSETIKQSITRDVATIDGQLHMLSNSLVNIDTTLTQAKLLSSGNRLQIIIGMMTRLRTKLEADMVNKKATSLLSGPYKDMGNQLTNASSQLGVMLNNISGGSTTDAALKAGLVQFKTAQIYVQAARYDIGTIVNGLKD